MILFSCKIGLIWVKVKQLLLLLLLFSFWLWVISTTSFMFNWLRMKRNVTFTDLLDHDFIFAGVYKDNGMIKDSRISSVHLFLIKVAFAATSLKDYFSLISTSALLLFLRQRSQFYI